MNEEKIFKIIKRGVLYTNLSELIIKTMFLNKNSIKMKSTI